MNLPSKQIQILHNAYVKSLPDPSIFNKAWNWCSCVSLYFVGKIIDIKIKNVLQKRNKQCHFITFDLPKKCVHVRSPPT